MVTFSVLIHLPPCRQNEDLFSVRQSPEWCVFICVCVCVCVHVPFYRWTGWRMRTSSIHRRTPTSWSPSTTTWSSNRPDSRTRRTTPAWPATWWPKDAAARPLSSFMVTLSHTHTPVSPSFMWRWWYKSIKYCYLADLMKKFTLQPST